MGNRALLVVTSHDQLGETGSKTGCNLPEVAQPYMIFRRAGLDCDFVSPKGGPAPMDPGNAEAFKDDKECQCFLGHQPATEGVQNTRTADLLDSIDYDVVFYAGGHGPMFDLPENEAIAKLAAQIYEDGGIVGAISHGTVGLIPVKLSNGEPILKGQTVTGFSNSKEEAVKLSSAMPFLLETRLSRRWAPSTKLLKTSSPKSALADGLSQGKIQRLPFPRPKKL